MVPYVNNAEEVEFAVSCAMYPTKGTRSVYFPQRCAPPPRHPHACVLRLCRRPLPVGAQQQC